MRIVFTLILFGQLLFGLAQSECNVDSFSFVETKAEYLGGQIALLKYLNKNIVLPESATREVSGRIYIQFVVCVNGSICCVEAIKNANSPYSQAAIDVIRTIPGKWKPAELNGVPVASYFKLPVMIHLK